MPKTFSQYAGALSGAGKACGPKTIPGAGVGVMSLPGVGVTVAPGVGIVVGTGVGVTCPPGCCATSASTKAPPPKMIASTRITVAITSQRPPFDRGGGGKLCGGACICGRVFSFSLFLSVNCVLIACSFLRLCRNGQDNIKYH
ncbi:MAG: hypothetical protein E6I80_20510 [Chloroflexi bacterium]|nr:MAG: hypothetical protein E6I80_20510 [Chloroflexota bacterium]